MTTRTHPLILVAAGTVTVASLAATAYFTGLLPTRGTPVNEPPALVATAPEPAVAPTAPAPAEAAKPATPKTETPKHESAKHPPAKLTPVAKSQPGTADRVADNHAANQKVRDESGSRANNDAGIDVIPAQRASTETARPVEQQAICTVCGTVESVQEIKTEGQGSGLGVIAGGVLGGLLGNQVGKGSGRDLGTIAGAIGGAFAGHQVEKQVRAGKRVEVSVRMDDGSYRTIDQEVAGRWQRGDRVRIENGRLQPY